MVVEIVSPQNETRDTLPFYAALGVDEAVVVNPVARTVDWLRSTGAAFAAAEQSALLDVSVADFMRSIDWPPVAEHD